jgi:hypothetical protein
LLYQERVEQQKPSFVAVVIVEGGSGAGSFLFAQEDNVVGWLTHFTIGHQRVKSRA